MPEQRTTRPTAARSPGSAPDLRASPLHHMQAAFRQILHDGTLASRGMPAFPEFTDAQIEALRHYIEAMARADRAPPR